MPELTTSSYDEVPYGNYVFSYSHPDRLATMATLFGLQPAPVDHCRVLDLGCGTGANIIPMALALPDSRFVGIDLSPRQIAMGQEVVRGLGLRNIDLQACSILDADESLGQFDYIICHGVFSWVPEEVQEKVLSICARNLSPRGIAYVSYNTYPGWHVRAMVREMMRFHVKQFSDPQECIQQAWALLEFLLESVEDKDSVYGRILQAETDLLRTASPTYFFHEHLEEVNHPIYFHQFVQRAGAQGLQYLSEARLMPLPGNLSSRVTETLKRIAVDLIHGEQYLDFVRNRQFRWTLLCHDDVRIQRPPNPLALLNMHVTGLVRPVSPEPDLASSVLEEFRNVEGPGLSTTQPLLKTALVFLAEATPQAVPFVALLDRIQTFLGKNEAPHASVGPQTLAEALLQCFMTGFVDLHVHPPVFSRNIVDHPVACPLARYLAEMEERVPNRRHRMVALNGFERQILRLLDGKHSRQELLRKLVQAVACGDLEIQRGEQALQDLDQVRKLMGETLEPVLKRLARSALLIG